MTLVNILIPTQPDDSHAAFVKIAIEKKGHRAILWYTRDYPTLQTHTFRLDNEAITWESDGATTGMSSTQFDVVWYRRARSPVMPTSMHEEDVENAKKENAMFYQSFWEMIAQDALWINSPDSRQAANCKPLQLKAAAKVGLRYPSTLMSNDPKKIKAFIENNASLGVVYKTFSPLMWFGDSESWLTYAGPITIDQLPSDDILQAVPGIFQVQIKKQYELRVTYFGDYYVAVKINSQIHPKAKQDWRFAPVNELDLSRVFLPDDIDKKCRKLMIELNLEFGCFDLIVTPDNEYYFLEVNEQGQFLWVEDVNPEIPMLDIFADFLINKGKYDSGERLPVITMNEIRTETGKLIDEAVMHHQGSVLMTKKILKESMQ